MLSFKKVLIWSGRLIATGCVAAMPFITLFILQAVYG